MFEIGSLIDQTYLVRREIGRGGFGIVYLADELGDDEILLDGGPRRNRDRTDRPVLRSVAIKVLSLEPTQWRRFRTEVHALCRLNHPGIVQVYRYGRDRVPYLAMEYVQGHAWNELLERQAGSSNPLRTIRALVQVAEALHHAHEREVVHRDLKPHNVLLTDDHLPKVVDFGLSMLLEPGLGTTQRIGTPGYLAPEILESNAAACDHRADIYSLGAMIFATFAGRAPFEGGSLHEIVKRQLAEDFCFPDAFPEGLRGLVRRCLLRDPTARPRTAAWVADELRRLAATTGTVMVGGFAAPLSSAAVRATERVDIVDARVRWLEVFDHPTRGTGVRLELTTGDAVTGAVVRAFAYANARGREPGEIWRQLSHLWPGAELSIFDAIVVEDSSGSRYLTFDNLSLLVIEPYLPVVATEIASVDGVRAGPCATRFTVDQRANRGASKPVVVGNLAHAMLERLHVRHIDPTDRAAFDRLFGHVLATQRIEAVAAGFCDADKAAIAQELREHFANLARWTGPNQTAGSGRLTEARRLSPRLGIEGRIDLALQDDESLRILELKTGRYESPQHEQQLRTYMMLWQSHARATNRRVEGRLLYSRTGSERALQPPRRDDERAILGARNEIVLLRHTLADGGDYRPPRPHDASVLCRDAACRFRRDRCINQDARLDPPHDDLSAADPAARAYYDHFVRLIEREHRERARRVGDLLRPGCIDIRVQAGDAIADAVVVDIDEPSGVATFACAARGVFGPDDTVLIHRGDVERELTLSGRVVRLDDGEITVSLASAGALLELPVDGWILDREEPRIGDRAMHRALFAFVAGVEPARRDLVCSPRRHDRSPEITPDAHGRGQPRPGLNDEQALAVNEALADRHPMLLVQGPPGTGKTQVVATLIAELVEAGQRVLLAAFTHTAVDNVVTRLVERRVPGLFRIGGQRGADPDLEAAMRRAGMAPDALFSEDIAAATPDLDLLRARVEAARVVACTAHAAVGAPIFDILESPLRRDEALEGTLPVFDVAVIDEASQLLEPLALGVLARARRWVLVGDDCQLRPVVSAPDAVTTAIADQVAPGLRAVGIGGLDRSLFERMKPFAPHVMLRVQYRMNEPVQAFPSRSFYGDRLRADGSAAERVLPIPPQALASLDGELARRLDPARPSVWVDSVGAESGHVCATEAVEVARTAAALWRLRLVKSRDVSDEAWLGVVTPFRAQAHAIREALAAELGDEACRIEVNTADRFQGREKEAILVSLVSRTWSDFVFDPRRLNVALTRARTKVILFGPRALGRRMLEVYAPRSGDEPAQRETVST